MKFKNFLLYLLCLKISQKLIKAIMVLISLHRKIRRIKNRNLKKVTPSIEEDCLVKLDNSKVKLGMITKLKFY
jgi:hypothetical protein